MKDWLISTLFLLINYNTNCQSWQNRWFTMEIPDNWRKPSINYNNYPPLKYNSTVLHYKDVRFAPSSGEDSGNLMVETFVNDNDKKLIYKDFIRKDSITLKEDVINLNNMNCLKRQAVLKTFDKDKILNYYCTIWYVQGKKRVYIITFGSYNKINYENNLPVVEKFITSFKEK